MAARRSTEAEDHLWHAHGDIEENRRMLLEAEHDEKDFEDSAISIDTFGDSERIALMNSRPGTPILEEKRIAAPRQTSYLLREKGLELLRMALPSFILSESRRQHVIDRSKLRPTAYMDGLRGVAAVVVLIHHFYSESWCPGINRGFGVTPDSICVSQLPYFRLIHSGWFAVSVFFVLSGYVLSSKPIQLARAHDFPGLVDNLSSAVFRRAFRLYVPILFITFCTSICVYNGWQLLGTPGTNVYVAPLPTFRMQMQEWADIVLKIMRPYEVDRPGNPKYNIHLWTINIEFRGSILTFLLVLCLAKVRPWIRISCLLAFTYYSMSIVKWDMALFFCGIVLAELACIRRESARRSPTANTPVLSYNPFSRITTPLIDLLPPDFHLTNHTRSLLSRSFWVFILLVALYLGSWPAGFAEKTPGYMTLASIVPAAFDIPDLRNRYWNFWGAVLLLAALENYPVLQRPFTTTLAQYFGKVSFALYIIHVPLAYTVTSPLGNALVARMGDWWGHFFGFFVCTALFFWVADLFWRFIDVKSVNFARWFYQKCLIRE